MFSVIILKIYKKNIPHYISSFNKRSNNATYKKKIVETLFLIL